MPQKNELQILEGLPSWFFDIGVSELWQKLQKPTMIRLAGHRSPKLFISVLLHGNEHTGFLALQKMLARLMEKSTILPRETLIFLGNIRAAEQNQRFLADQKDHNRIWDDNGESEEFVLANAVKNLALEDGIFACVDVHNNTGKNPHYGCISKMTEKNFYLASCFGRTVVYFVRPAEALSRVMSEHCPSITLECGLSAEERGTNHAAEFLDGVLHLDHFPEKPIAKYDIDLYETQVRMQLKPEITYEFRNGNMVPLKFDDCNVLFSKEMDSLNFVEQNPGYIFGYTKLESVEEIFDLNDDEGKPLKASDYFKIENQAIVNLKTVVPAMLTLDKRVIEQDCLGYLMQRVKY